MSFSEKFIEIMNSNIRPKCEPKITVSGTAENGTAINLEWNAKDIKSLTFHRSIDPVGRTALVVGGRLQKQGIGGLLAEVVNA